MLPLPAKIVQRLDMPEAFAGDGAEGQGAEEIHKKDFRYVKELSLIHISAPVFCCLHRPFLQR